jgi:hypothetical protein
MVRVKLLAVPRFWRRKIFRSPASTGDISHTRCCFAIQQYISLANGRKRIAVLWQLNENDSAANMTSATIGSPVFGAKVGDKVVWLNTLSP